MSIQINVLQELRHPLGSESSYELDEPNVRLDETEFQDVAGSLGLLRTDQGLLASLKLRGTVRKRCARCLAEAACPVEMEFEEEFIATVDPNTGAHMCLSKDQEGFTIGPDFILDLDEAIRQYGLMAEPVKPLCRPDCAGLCPSCGANLNEVVCGCEPPVDDRLGVLAGIDLKDQKRS
jgi:DUF177 domain-containing protein